MKHRKWGTSAPNSQRSGALAWMFLAAGGSSAVGGVPGLVRWLWGNQPLFSLWVPSMAINWLPAALGRGTTDANNWKASSSSAKPIPTESGRASVDFWTYSEQMWTWKGEEEGCSGGKDLLTLLNLTRDRTKAQISPLKACFCKRLVCEYVNVGMKVVGECAHMFMCSYAPTSVLVCTDYMQTCTL